MSQKPLTVRKKNYQFENSIKKHYWRNRSLLTNFINSLHILFPAGERYFARVLNQAAKKLNDDKIKKLAKSFAGQEIQHSLEHDKILNYLKEQGYKAAFFEDALTSLLKWAENTLPLEMNMAIIAGIEHFTALIGHIALEDPTILEDMNPQMRELLEWHAAEEIEHKAAAFDVNQALNSSYLLRCTGMIIAGTGVYGFITSIVLALTIQEKKLISYESLDDAMYLFFGKHQLFGKTFIEFLKYFQPGFHPDQVDDYYLAEQVLCTQNKQSA